uniref:Exostosin domain-containing protein n=1 Tax=Globodera pallida TaxID=36090 RepID=A0A183C8Q3_GLOPA
MRCLGIGGNDQTHTVLPRGNYKIAVYFGPIGRGRSVDFFTDAQGSIKWNFRKQIHNNFSVNNSYKDMSKESSVKVSILVQNNVESRILRDFQNYAQMAEAMAPDGRLYECHHIVFANLILFEPPTEAESYWSFDYNNFFK